jgi:hypothetical protein
VAKTTELFAKYECAQIIQLPAFYSKQSDILLRPYGITPEDPSYVLLVRRNSVPSQLEARGFTHDPTPDNREKVV